MCAAYFRSKTRCKQYLVEGLLAVVSYPLLILPPPVVALERSGSLPKFKLLMAHSAIFFKHAFIFLSHFLMTLNYSPTIVLKSLLLVFL